jgi:hypothetical protein
MLIEGILYPLLFIKCVQLFTVALNDTGAAHLERDGHIACLESERLWEQNELFDALIGSRTGASPPRPAVLDMNS